MTPRTFWLSFTDPDKPKGRRFLGVCVIDVYAYDAAIAKREIDVRFPNHAPDAEWIAAAQQKAYGLGCNPGGEVMICEIPSNEPVPRNRLLVDEELERWGAQPGKEEVH